MTEAEIEQLKDIRIVVLKNGKDVYAGSLRGINEFISKGKSADRVKLRGDRDSIIANFRYEEFKFLVRDIF